MAPSHDRTSIILDRNGSNRKASRYPEPLDMMLSGKPSENGLMLSLDGCRARQRRLLSEMARSQFDLFVTANYRTVYYFTGQLLAADAPCAFVAWARENRVWSRRPLKMRSLMRKGKSPFTGRNEPIALPHQDARTPGGRPAFPKARIALRSRSDFNRVSLDP